MVDSTGLRSPSDVDGDGPAPISRTLVSGATHRLRSAVHLQRDARAQVGLQAIPLLLSEFVEVALHGGVVVAHFHGYETRTRWASPHCHFLAVARRRLDGLAKQALRSALIAFSAVVPGRDGDS